MRRHGELKLDTDFNQLLWSVGWNYIYALVGMGILGMILGYSIDGALGFWVGLLVFFASPVVAVLGFGFVLQRKSSVIENGISEVTEEVDSVTSLDEEDTEKHALISEAGDSLPLLPSPERQVSTLVVADSLLLVHDRAEVDLPGLSWEVGESTKEFYFDHVASVDYEPHKYGSGGVFRVNTADGDTAEWESTTDASDALNTVQNRLRAYKTST